MLARRMLLRHSSTSSVIPRPLLQASTSSILRQARAPTPLRKQIVRHEATATSGEAGENLTGEIKTKPSEGIFFFNYVFPLKLQWLNRLAFLNPDRYVPELLNKVNQPDIALADPTDIVRRAIPEHLPLKIKEVTPRVREGGAFVKFSHDGRISDEELENTLSAYLEEKPIRPWFNPFRRVRAALVQGKPWIEDLYRLPRPRLKIEFLPTTPESAAAELSQETLFSLFRKYGKIAEIIPQPSDSKVTPRFAYVDYTRLRFATMARNCLYNYVVSTEQGGGKTGTVLRLTYESRAKQNWIRDWITGHPRIVIPIIVALLTAASVAVFDPIRTWFIKMHITHALALSDQVVVKWIRNFVMRSYDIIRFRKRSAEEEGMRAVWEDRQTSIAQLQTWMAETADTFIVVQGPRGSGKRQLVSNEALKDRPNKLIIDCKHLTDARGDAQTINAAAAEVGYKPVFSWMNSISSLIDLAAMGTIGTKTGFSETLENQIVKILGNTGTALQQVALSYRKNDDKDALMADDDWLEQHPEARPVVIIDNFLHKGSEGAAGMIYDKLADWAAGLTTRNVAHVVFLTTDISFNKSLSKALPDQVFRVVSLGDCSPEVAKKLVIQHIDSEATEDVVKGESKLTPSQRRNDLDELDSVIQILGGRLLDLEFLARRLTAGESPGRAVTQIIEQSASEILKMYLLDGDSGARKWTSQQAWILIKKLSEGEPLRYNEVLLDDCFGPKDGPGVLSAMEQAELITITSKNGRPQTIKPGKPVYQAAFEYLLNDDPLRCRLNLAVLTQLIAIENKNVDKYETELKMLADLPGTPNELKPRIKWLLGKALTAHGKVEKYEAESAKMKKLLAKEY